MKLKGRLQTWATVLVYLVLAFILTSEAWLSGDALVGVVDPVDRAGTIWVSWWTGEALSQGLSPFFGSQNFYPIGQSPVAQYNILDALFFAPLIHLLGPRTGYNLAATLTLASTAGAMHYLARSIRLSAASALVAGLTLATSGFLLLEIGCGRLSQALLLFWLFALSGILRIRAGDGSLKLSVLTGIAAAASTLIYWYYGIFLLIVGVLVWITAGERTPKPAWTQIASVCGIALVICLPFVFLLAGQFEQLPGVERPTESWISYPGLDQGRFGLANAIRHSNWAFWPLLQGSVDTTSKLVPLVILILAGWAILQRAPGWKQWASVSTAGWILAMGPYLQDFKQNATSIPLPFLALWNHVPFFSRFWWPRRFELMLFIGIGMLAALGLQKLLDRWPKSSPAMMLLIPLLIAIESPFRNPHVPIQATPEPGYSKTLYEGLEGALLTTPVLWENDYSRTQLWLQAHHELPILGGLGDNIASHRPPGWEAWVRSNPILNALADLAVAQFQGVTLEPGDAQSLLDAGFRYAVVDSATQAPALANQWTQTHLRFFEAVWGEPIREIPGGAVWEIQPIEEPKWVYTSFQSGARKARPTSTRSRIPEKKSPPQSED